MADIDYNNLFYMKKNKLIMRENSFNLAPNIHQLDKQNLNLQLKILRDGTT